MGGFDLVLPSPAATGFLRACLLGGEAGRTAFDEWLARVGDPFAALRHGHWRLKTELPLLQAALRGNGSEPEDPAFRTHLRAAAEFERLRAESHRHILGEALARLAAHGHRPRLLGAALLAETVYPAPELRHCYGVDLLVLDTEIRDVRRALASFAAPSTEGDAVLHHPAGVPIRMHTALTPPYYADSTPDPSRATTEIGVLGQRCATVGRELMLTQICSQAFFSGLAAGDVSWVSDAWFTLAATPNLSWEAVLGMAGARRLHIPLAPTLRYLRDEIGIPIPEAVTEHVGREARRAPRTERDMARSFAWRAVRRGAVDGCPPRLVLGDALAFARWGVAPSRGYLRATRSAEGSGGLVRAYARRPLRLARRSWHRAGVS